MKKLLSLDDLYSYYSSKNKSVHFSSEEDNSNIIVQVKGNLNFQSDEDKHTEGLLPVRLESCHIGENLNKSYISKEVMTKAMPSFANRPILAYIHEVDGRPEFYGHNFEVNDDGEIEYQEIPVGIVSESCNARFKSVDDKEYCVVDGYIFEDYTKAAEILKREQKCDVSVELAIKELSYNAKDEVLVIEDFFFSGVTILGVDTFGNKIEPGMAGSNITIADFSSENNSMFSENEDLMNLLSEVKEKLDSIQINYNLRKEETIEMKDIIETQEATPENVVFEEEDTKKKKDESGKEDDDDTIIVAPNPEEAEEGEDDNTTSSDNNDDNDDTNTDDNDDDNSDDNDNDDTTDSSYYSKTFSLSHDDIRCALYVLLSAYEEADNEYYFIVDIFDDKFIYTNGCGKIYGQNYVKDDTNVSFDGERYNLNLEYLTDSEYATLKEMRGSYSEMKDKLEKYDEEPQKIEILNSEDYAQITETDEFKELKTQEAHFDMSIEDVKAKADEILLSYAKGHKIEFSINKPNRVLFANPESKTESRYGGIFND